MPKKKHLYFFKFSPTTKAPFSVHKKVFKNWWDKELQLNNTKAIDEFEVTEDGAVGGENKEEGARIYSIWLELRKAHKWLLNRL